MVVDGTAAPAAYKLGRSCTTAHRSGSADGPVSEVVQDHARLKEGALGHKTEVAHPCRRERRRRPAQSHVFRPGWRERTFVVVADDAGALKNAIWCTPLREHPSAGGTKAIGSPCQRSAGGSTRAAPSRRRGRSRAPSETMMAYPEMLGRDGSPAEGAAVACIASQEKAVAAGSGAPVIVAKI